MLSTIIAAIIIFGVLIFVHEFGHYIVARFAKMRVLEFAMGFGKVILGWERNGTRYTLRAFPLGGFCRLLGTDPEEAGMEGSFQEKPLPSRLAVIAAGSLMNFVLGIVLFSFIYFCFLGVPQTHLTSVGDVSEDSIALEAGIQSGDKIHAINGEQMKDWEQVVSTINAHPEERINLLVHRGNEELHLNVVPENIEGRGLIGISPVYEKYAFFSSVSLGFLNTWLFIELIFVSLYSMIVGTIPADVAGPVGIVAVIGDVMQEGMENLVFLAAIISVNLGIINLLPFPALDGSRLVFLVMEGIRGKPVDPEKEGFIHFIGFAILIMLMIFISFQDVTRFIF